ncbi:hypothetical protein KAR91_79690 [Candidatus Pacearchaeota archaeon]|nr:hypothetical protein [Candidatus Pacearchaeota archaeon]
MAKLPSLLTVYYKQEGVRDIRPLMARGLFAKALLLEDKAGKTTPEAEETLDLAIQALK